MTPPGLGVPGDPNPFGPPPTPADALARRLYQTYNEAQARFNGSNSAFRRTWSDGQIVVVGLDDLRTFPR